MLLNDVVPGMRLAKSIYSPNGTLMLGAGTIFKQEYVAILKSKGFNAAYIGEIPADIEIPEVVSEEVRMEASIILRQAMNDIRKTGTFDPQGLENIVDVIIDEILSKKDIIVNTIDLKTINDYTFRHSVNVCILSLMMGRSLLYSRKKMHILGMGALLHDVGKSLVPTEILEKKSLLTNEEFEEIQKHAQYGYQILAPFDNVNLLAKHVAYQHHERLSGSGYPRNLNDTDIVDYAKVVAIADSYDAMTSDRPYNKRSSPAQAIKELSQPTFKGDFDQKALDRLVKIIAPYPVGMKVGLSDGRRAAVIKVNSQAIDRPVVTILAGENDMILTTETLDLSIYENINIDTCDY